MPSQSWLNISKGLLPLLFVELNFKYSLCVLSYDWAKNSADGESKWCQVSDMKKKSLSLTKLRKLKIFSFPKSNWFWFELNGFLWCQFLCHFFLFAVGRATKNVKNGESPCKYCFVKRSLNHVRLWKSILTRQLLYKTSSDVTKTLSSKVDTVGFQAAVIIVRWSVYSVIAHSFLQKLYRRISFVQNCLSTNYTVVLFVQSLTNKSFPRQISTFFFTEI